ncbi:MAG: hypothetical protein HXS54_10775 [Theionarchaea archaeon]|nr:hypothetical protein [Theionarchaea archaeon]
MNDRQKISLIVLSLVTTLAAVVSVTASSLTSSSPYFAFRMEQASNEKNFLPASMNAFTYTTEKGYVLHYNALVDYCDEVKLFVTLEHTCVPTCVPTCSPPTCVLTCWNTCEPTCQNYTCPDTCWNTCEPTCQNYTCPDTCPDTCGGSCYSTCETCDTCDGENTCVYDCAETSGSCSGGTCVGC